MADNSRVRELGNPDAPLTQAELADIERFQVQRRKHPVPEDAWLYVAEIDRLLAHIRIRTAPLCEVHQRLEDADALECEIGNDCVACSLNERRELLGLIAPYAAEGNIEDSVTVLRRVAEFYETHVGEGRVIVSYPAATAPLAGA